MSDLLDPVSPVEALRLRLLNLISGMSDHEIIVASNRLQLDVDADPVSNEQAETTCPVCGSHRHWDHDLRQGRSLPAVPVSIEANEEPDEGRLVDEAIEYLESIGYGEMADAVASMADRNEAMKATWEHCDCGARKPARCPVCDDHAVMPCICREYRRADRRS